MIRRFYEWGNCQPNQSLRPRVWQSKNEDPIRTRWTTWPTTWNKTRKSKTKRVPTAGTPLRRATPLPPISLSSSHMYPQQIHLLPNKKSHRLINLQDAILLHTCVYFSNAASNATSIISWNVVWRSSAVVSSPVRMWSLTVKTDNALRLNFAASVYSADDSISTASTW